MKSTALALLAVVGNVAAQGVTSAVAPTGTAPAGCKPSQAGNFEIAVVDVVSKRDLTRRTSACSSDGILVAALSDGVIKDAKDRVGYIASNYQFQFDGPPQAGAIYTAGFSVCGNGSLALGSSTVFYKCQSGDFFNLYDRSWAAQCSPVEIAILPCSTDPSDPAVQSPDGQVVGTEVITTTVVVPLSDGQPQVVTTTMPVPLCQITDGQLQVHTTPCASVTPAPSASTTPIPASQYSDGQIQITPGGAGTTVTAVPVTGGGGGGGAGTTVSLPTETFPVVTSTAPTVSIIGSNSTLRTTALPSTPASSSARASGTSAPASGSTRVGLSASLAALAIGVFAAVWGL